MDSSNANQGTQLPLLILSQPSADMAMMATFATSGWLDVMIDLEHSPHGESDIIRALVALERAGGTLHLKMANLDPQPYRRFLHFGVRNFILPLVEGADSVRSIREALAEYYWIDQSAIRLTPLVESRAALRKLPEICAEEGISSVQIGLIDLALDLGLTFQGYRHFETLGRALMPHLLEALDAIRACGKLNGCMLMPRWFDFFPLNRIDRVTVPVRELLTLATELSTKGNSPS